MALSIITDMRRQLVALQLAASAGELSPERFRLYTTTLANGLDTVEGYLDAAAVNDDGLIREGDQIELTPAGYQALGQRPTQRGRPKPARVVGHLSVFNGDRP